MNSISRRDFVKTSGAVSLLAAALPEVANGAEPVVTRKLNVLCVGGHPDDPESGCAGTLSRYAALGHNVSILYLTRGERGIRGKSLDEAAKIRSAECEAACKIIGATPHFFGQTDGATEATRAHVDAMTKLLTEQKTDVVFTHWPIDTHMDHQVASFLTIRACMALGHRPRLYFFEVDTGAQTEGFQPDTYIDVSNVLEKKKAALLAHVSQGGDAIWRDYHEVIALWRGRESGVKAAEAFVHLSRDVKSANLPALS
jgi:LmbE family N-acetylglucosaminyl deacetylase